MGRLRSPWTSQPPLGTGIDPYWAARGLQLVFDGQRVVFNRESSALQPRALGGTPKFRNSLKGIVTGIGATSGTGTTDRIDSGVLDAPKSGMRSVVAHLYANGTGGGGLGRVFQTTSGSGVANAGDEAVYINTSGILFTRQTSTVTGASYTTTSAFPLNRWAAFGYSFLCDYPTNTVPLMFLDGVSTAVTTTAAAAAAFTAGTSINLSWGNRSSDSARSFDGMIGPVLIFDGYLTPQEHAKLAANPWQVFAPLARNVYFGVSAGGSNTPINPGVGSLALTGYAPTVAQTANQSLTLGAGSLAITGYAPSIAQPQGLTPGAGSLTITGYAPTVTQGVDNPVNPGVGSITLTGYAPTIAQTANQSITAGAGSVAITGYAPTLAQTANQDIAPGVGSIAITGYAPSVVQASASIAVNPDAGVLTITGYAPEVTQSGVGGGSDDSKAKQRDKVRRKVAKLNAEILEKEQTVAPEKTTSTKLVKAISKKAIQQVFDEDEDEVLMLLLS